MQAQPREIREEKNQGRDGEAKMGVRREKKNDEKEKENPNYRVCLKKSRERCLSSQTPCAQRQRLQPREPASLSCLVSIQATNFCLFRDPNHEMKAKKTKTTQGRTPELPSTTASPKARTPNRKDQVDPTMSVGELGED